MKPTVLHCHKSTTAKLTYKFYLLMCAASTSLFWVAATNQPIKAQVNNQPITGASSESTTGELLPVPQSPWRASKKATFTVPPPPSEWQQNTVSPIGTDKVSGLNMMFLNSPSSSLSQLENSFIGQKSKRTSSLAAPTQRQPLAIGGSSEVEQYQGNTPNNLSNRIGLPQLQNSVVSQSIGQPSQSGNTTTQEFTAPSAVPTGSPTFNQLLNSQSSSRSTVAPLPPLVGEIQQGSANLVTNSNTTFNQLLNTPRGSQANLIGGVTPTFNQLLNSQPVVNKTNVNSSTQPTFEQILNAQQGSGQSGGQFGAQNAPFSYEQILNAAPIGNPSGSMAQVPQTFNQILNSQGGTFPAPGEQVRQSELRSQARPETEARPLLNSTALTEPSLRVEGVYVTQKETSARARVAGIYPLTPNVLFGATLDLVSNGSTFTDSRNEGLNINELYFATSLTGLPNLRFVVGQLDLTSFFDRNSFAKDGASQFFNPVFQTNPALAATGIASRPSLLVNWSVTDNIDAKAAVFSSSNSLSNFTLDGFAGEVGIRYGNAIIRGTYATDRDGGNRDSFPEIFSISRGNGQFGILRDDREEAYGLNAEVYIPNIKLGLFGRYGRYENRDANRSADTYVLGASLLDLFTPDDRLGIAYGQALTSDSLRRGDRPDVLEMYYDFPFLSNLRLGFTVQGRDSFDETVLGIRVKSDFDITPRGRVR
jgi:hypothetical protein